MVFVDWLTKMVRLAPMRNDFLASDVIDLVISQLFRYHGDPTDLVIDTDPRLTSAFFPIVKKGEIRMVLRMFQDGPRMDIAQHPSSLEDGFKDGN